MISTSTHFSLFEHTYCLSVESSSEKQPQPTGDRQPAESEREYILVVDDEDRVADSIVEILNSFGYKAVATYDGTSAIAEAKKECPDVLLCDVLMPNMNGVETAKAIQDVCPKTRVLLFSGHAGTQDIVQDAISAGRAFKFLRKPLHPTALLNNLKT
jgi:CheY-like chemotaxis protein